MAVISVLTWLVALEVVGLAALPLAVRVFRRLDDYGYGLAKPLGLALVAYGCWLLASLGLLNSTQPTVVLLTALLAIGLWSWNGRAALAVLRGQHRLVILSEVVFLLAFGLAVLVRAYGAAINGQEKFMDMAIFNAFLRGDQMPAEDPWLSGFGMAYYYLGYFLWALVAKAVDTPPAVGYNLALAGTFGLLATALFGLAYTLVRAQLRPGETPSPQPPPPIGGGGVPAESPPPGVLPPSFAGCDAEYGERRWAGGLGYPASSPFLPTGERGRGGEGAVLPLAAALAAVGVVATAVMGNLQAAVEVAIRQGFGDVAWWQSFGVKNVHPPGAGLFPDDGAWWFAAARVIPNVPPDGITEFPWFSLMLGDLHPHYVALPFELLAIGLALAGFRNLLAGGDQRRLDVGVGALALGLLIPLNTWDVGTFWVIYALAVVGGLVVAAQMRARAAPMAGGEVVHAALPGGASEAGGAAPDAGAAVAGPGASPPSQPVTVGRRLRLDGALSPLVLRAAALLGPTFGLALLLYVPYFLGYQSQPLALGIVTERTMLGSIVILFGPFLVLAIAAVARGWLDARADPDLRAFLGRQWWVIGLALIVALAPLARLTPVPPYVGFRDPTLSLLLLLLVGLLPLVVAARRGPGAAILAPTGTLLLACAIGLLLGTELLYLRDSFGSRMNTVFKFYYHVWLLLGLLSPLLVVYLLRGRANLTPPTPENLTPPTPLPSEGRREPATPAAGAGLRNAQPSRGSEAPVPPSFAGCDAEYGKRRWAGGLGYLGLALGVPAVALAALLTIAGLLYPVGATWAKNNAFRGPPTLDGAAWMETARPGDAQAIRWLRENMPGRPVIAEAWGDDYSESARVSTFSGLPTLLGWIGHELQWRGNQPMFEQRKQTIEAIYRNAESGAVPLLLQAQNVDYVYVGGMEVEKYGPGVRDRFEGLLETVYRGGDVTIYRVPRPTSIGVGLAELRP